MSRPFRLLSLCAAAAWLALGGVAGAAVLQIGPQGVTVYDTPAVFTAQGAAPIVATVSSGRADRSELGAALDQAAIRHAVPAPLVRAVAWRESRLHQDAVSPKGALGVMQLMPATARDLHVDPRDWRQNIDGGAAYLAAMLARYRGDQALALAAYDAGPGAVDRHGGAPPYAETRRYVAEIRAQLAPAAAPLLILGR